MLLVARTSLGTINHTLLSLAALRAARLNMRGVMMVGKPNGENREAIEHYGEIEVVGAVPMLAEMNRTALIGRISEDILIAERFSHELRPANLASVHAGGSGSAADSHCERRGRLPLHRRWPAADRRDLVVVGEYPRPRPSGDHGRDRPSKRESSITCCWRDLRTKPWRNCAAIAERVCPAALEHIFFSDDGSTAVEVALKMAVQYWQNVGQPEKKSIVALEHAYHGDTVGAMSVGAESGFTEPFRALLFPVHRVHSAYCYRCPVGKKRATCDIDCVDELERLLAEKHGEIAAVIVEPLLQGAGGMIVHPVEFLQRVRRTMQRAQRAADRGRSADRIWALRKNVCVRAGECVAGHDVPVERADGRRASHGRDGLHRARFTRLS